MGKAGRITDAAIHDAMTANNNNPRKVAAALGVSERFVRMRLHAINERRNARSRQPPRLLIR
jgi:hypothetical protein